MPDLQRRGSLRDWASGRIKKRARKRFCETACFRGSKRDHKTWRNEDPDPCAEAFRKDVRAFRLQVLRDRRSGRGCSSRMDAERIAFLKGGRITAFFCCPLPCPITLFGFVRPFPIYRSTTVPIYIYPFLFG